jgi:hypothetical protein
MSSYWTYLVVLIFIVSFTLELLAVGLISGYIATMMGVTGVVWWLIVVFFIFLINSLLLAISRVGVVD